MPIERFTYSFRTETVGDEIKYFAAFMDGEGNRQEIEISCEVYLALDQCRREERRQVNAFTRHLEHLELSEAQLAARVLISPQPMEEAVLQATDVQATLATLSETQRRRFLLYHEHGLNMEQIADVEGCSHPAVLKSIAIAQEKLKKYFSEGGYKTGV